MTITPQAALLSRVEQQCLANYEQTIERGLGVFYEVGNALAQIRDWRLYRASYRTFEDYCIERWGMVASRARQLISSAEVVSNLKSVTTVTLPANEAQTRPLARLEPKQQVQVYLEATATAPGGKLTAAHIDQVASVRYPAVQPVPPSPEPAPDRLAVMKSSASSEWYTPPKIIERVLMLLDDIDLDPCSNSATSPNVPAHTLYTREDDGLKQQWEGRVYLNPPYGDTIGSWIDKLIIEYQAMQVEAAIALIPARTDTAWFWPLWQYPLCFVRGRLKFISPVDSEENSAPFGSVIAYLGTDIKGFTRYFGDLGHIVMERDYLARKGR